MCYAYQCKVRRWNLPFNLARSRNLDLIDSCLMLPDRWRSTKTSTGLIVKQMEGTVVMWDVQTRQNRIVCTVPEKRWFAYAVDADQLLIRTADESIVVIHLASNAEVTLTKGAYESGSLSANGTLAVLSEGDEQIEVWQIKSSDTVEALEREQIHPQKIEDFGDSDAHSERSCPFS